MIRGHFHIFACRSGEEYAKKLVEQLEFLLQEQASLLQKKTNLTLHEQAELEFIRNRQEDGINIGKSKIMHFKDGEMNVLLDPAENVRDKDVFLVQNPYNKNNGLTSSENLMEMFLFLDALHRAKAKTVTLISLYFPYGRGDKQHAKDGVPASLLANLLTTAGMDNLITMDLHADQITGFFNPHQVHVEHLHASPLIIHYFKDKIDEKTKIAAPDPGAGKLTHYFAKALHKSMILAYKKRSYELQHTIDEIRILGLPGNSDVLIVDDIVSSGESAVKVIDAIKQEGVKNIYVSCTHPLLVGDAVEKFEKMFQDPDNPFRLLVGTDAVPQDQTLKKKPWYVEIDTSRFIAKAIYELHTSGSISCLMNPFCVEEQNLWIDKD